MPSAGVGAKALRKENAWQPRPVSQAAYVHCLVTAGPTFEPIDQVRRLTNFSTGRLGSELAACLAAAGHQVTLLLGEQATWTNLPAP